MSFLADEIRKEAEKLVRRHQKYAWQLAEQLNRIQNRTGVVSQKIIQIPQHWAADPGFNPYHVRANASVIAHAIRRSISTGSYRPRPACRYVVPKPGGGEREVSVFQVADNAISRLVYRRLTEKNAPRFSARCYSYRRDVSIHDAVFHAASELRSSARVYVAEFDFSKFFDSINHEHINKIIKTGGFLITRHEDRIIRSFLETQSVDAASYATHPLAERTTGIPQGTSISLFLANAVGHPLDRRLEQLAVGFVRFADDTLIWSKSYDDICIAVDALNESALEMGVNLNLKKSDGISLLTKEGERGEIRTKESINLLGYSISRSRVGIRRSTIDRAKEHISYLVYSNLIQPLNNGHNLPSRYHPPVDRDYVVAVFQVRRFLYGGLSESKVRKFLTKGMPSIRYYGFMSFYPLVDDEALLSSLDGWLLGVFKRSLELRASLLGIPKSALPPPHNYTKKQLINMRVESSDGSTLDLRLPSFRRMGALLRKASMVFGPNSISHPTSGNYYVF